MAKISLSIPAVDYQAVLDTEVMDVTIREAFVGVTFVTLEGRKMVVTQRDGYFEISYDKEPPVIYMGVGLG